MTLSAAPPGFEGATLAELLAGAEPLAVHETADGCHLVLRRGRVLHRIWLRCTRRDHPLAAVIACDGLAVIRRRAAADLEARHATVQPAGNGAMPTAFQAWRLHLLLAILDLDIERGGGATSVTSHEVARRIVYPGLAIGRGLEWKTAPERRRTQRLIGEARALAAGGYRALLAHRGGRQK